MKLFFLLLFALSTITTALHELQHIHAHDSNSCQVCVVDDHSNSFDIVAALPIVDVVHIEEDYRFTCKAETTAFQHFSPSRAPPLS